VASPVEVDLAAADEDVHVGVGVTRKRSPADERTDLSRGAALPVQKAAPPVPPGLR